jgi:hypothetical protein
MATPLIRFRVLTPINTIKKYIEDETTKKTDRIADGMCELGKKCAEIAVNLPQNGSRAQYPVPYTQLPKHQPNYVDWTGNLRESIGWAVLKNGKEYMSDLGKIENTRTYFQRLKNLTQYTNGIVLLVMATGKDPKTGKGYARYVQALGYDVLASSQLELEASAVKMISRFLNK